MNGKKCDATNEKKRLYERNIVSSQKQQKKISRFNGFFDRIHRFGIQAFQVVDSIRTKKCTRESKLLYILVLFHIVLAFKMRLP